MYGKLREALRELRSLNHDELINLLVLLQFEDKNLRSPRFGERRKGKRRGLYKTSGIECLVLSSTMALNQADRAIVYETAEALAEALAPKGQVKRDSESGQPLARGVVQTKLIPRSKLNLETGEVELHWYGPYLYIRIWTTGGDGDRRKRRLKNVYIRGSRNLAVAFDSDQVTANEILDAFQAGTIYELAKRFGSVDSSPDAAANGESAH